MKSWYTGALLAMAALAPAAHGSTVTLSGPSTAAQNSTFMLALGLNASDAPGTHPGIYVGSVTIDFDPALLSYQGFVITGPVVQQGSATIGSASGHTTVTIAFNNATDLSEIGKFSLKALGSVGSNAVVGLHDADTFFGTFISTLPTNQPFYPTFIGKTVQITAVPLPAAAWLFGAALGLLGTQRRRACA